MDHFVSSTKRKKYCFENFIRTTPYHIAKDQQKCDYCRSINTFVTEDPSLILKINYWTRKSPRGSQFFVPDDHLQNIKNDFNPEHYPTKISKSILVPKDHLHWRLYLFQISPQSSRNAYFRFRTPLPKYQKIICQENH